MLNENQDFQNFILNPSNFWPKSDYFIKVVNKYEVLFLFTQENINKAKDQITNKIEISKAIVINSRKEETNDNKELYFIIGFDYMVIITNIESLKKIVQLILSTNKDIEFSFISDTKELFDKIKIKYKISNNKFNNCYFEKEIAEFNKNIAIKSSDEKYNELWKMILPCISGYLIKQGYIKSSANRILKFYNNQNQSNKNDQKFDLKKCIEIRVINGSIFTAKLMYHFEDQQLYVIKIKNGNECDNLDSLKRELKNYMKIKHPFIPMSFNKSINDDYIVIEFINGITLNKIQDIDLSESDVLSIIIQLLVLFHYLHINGFVYRDLHQRNIMIDINKMFVLIDFDQMVSQDLSKSYEFIPAFDVYSIGNIISFIIEETKITEDCKQKLNIIFEQCKNKDPSLRPTIPELICDFHSFYYFNFRNKLLNHLQEVRFLNDLIEENKDYYYIVKELNNSIKNKQMYLLPSFKNLDKILDTFLLATYNNDPKALNDLGDYYYNGKLGKINTNIINKSIYYYSLAADLNDPNAQFSLGCIYLEGINVKQNINKALRYFTMAADQNHSRAQYDLSYIYIKGIYIQKDIKKSIYYLNLAANNNHQLAQFNLAILYRDGKYLPQNINKAIHYFSLCANQNNYADAQCALGNIYFTGRYVKQDINKAIHYYELAAEKNHPIALYHLGNIYVNKDIEKGFNYYLRSAEQNNPNAQYNLGMIYYERKDIQNAIVYLTKAANQNHSSAQNNLGNIYIELAWNKNNHYKKEYIDQAIKYLSLADNNNNSNAQYQLGNIFYERKFIKQDINKAIHYYSRAANQNNANAQYKLGNIFSEGKYIKKDINKAIYYYSCAAGQNIHMAKYKLGIICYHKQEINKFMDYLTQAASKNNSMALYKLGFIFYEGKYVKQDINKSIEYLKQAADLKNSNAQLMLGIFYCNGTITQDINKSIYYLTLSASQNNSFAQYNLGLIYSSFLKSDKDMITGINYYIQSSSNGISLAHFKVGFFYHEGRYIPKNILESIKYYKEASSFKIQYAKNNLGIIYKNGIEDIISKNIGNAIIFFDEAINQKNDKLSMYNLAHIYLYEIEKEIDKSINLLIKLLLDYDFPPCKLLLCIALIHKYSFDFNKIYNILAEKTNISIATNIILIIHQNLYDETTFNIIYEKYKTVDFLYDYQFFPIISKKLFAQKRKQIDINKDKKNVTDDFYEGFGFDLERKQMKVTNEFYEGFGFEILIKMK